MKPEPRIFSAEYLIGGSLMLSLAITPHKEQPLSSISSLILQVRLSTIEPSTTSNQALVARWQSIHGTRKAQENFHKVNARNKIRINESQ
jgi:hypothetical protein